MLLYSATILSNNFIFTNYQAKLAIPFCVNLDTERYILDSPTKHYCNRKGHFGFYSNSWASMILGSGLSIMFRSSRNSQKIPFQLVNWAKSSPIPLGLNIDLFLSISSYPFRSFPLNSCQYDWNVNNFFFLFFLNTFSFSFFDWNVSFNF